jgi:hypothetical protein
MMLTLQWLPPHRPPCLCCSCCVSCRWRYSCIGRATVPLLAGAQGGQTEMPFPDTPTPPFWLEGTELGFTALPWAPLGWRRLQTYQDVFC